MQSLSVDLSTFPFSLSSSLFHSVQECCYRSPTETVGPGALALNLPDGGNAQRFSNLVYDSVIYSSEETLPYSYCCVQEPSLCGYFYEKRPSGGASGYESAQIGKWLCIDLKFLFFVTSV